MLGDRERQLGFFVWKSVTHTTLSEVLLANIITSTNEIENVMCSLEFQKS